MKGWIKLHRCIQDDWVWDFDNPKQTLAWIDLLIMANHGDKNIRFNGSPLAIKKGSLVTSEVKLAERWSCTRKTVRKYLKNFEDDGMITRIADNRKTLITIENYGVYQSLDDLGTQQSIQQDTQQDIQQSGQQGRQQGKQRGKQQGIHKQELRIKNEELRMKNEEEVLPKGNTNSSLDVFVKAWNDLAEEVGLAKVKTLNDKRKRKLTARLTEHGAGGFTQALDEIRNSDFLLGKKTNWKITFDWLIENETNILKILEGNYKNNKKKTAHDTFMESLRKEAEEEEEFYF